MLLFVKPDFSWKISRDTRSSSAAQHAGCCSQWWRFKSKLNAQAGGCFFCVRIDHIFLPFACASRHTMVKVKKWNEYDLPIWSFELTFAQRYAYRQALLCIVNEVFKQGSTASPRDGLWTVLYRGGVEGSTSLLVMLISLKCSKIIFYRLDSKAQFPLTACIKSTNKNRMERQVT